GLQFKRNNDYLIVPISNNYLIKINADIRKTALIKLPTVEGLLRYLDYLEEEHIFEQMKDFTEEKLLELRNIIVGALAEAGTQSETNAPNRGLAKSI
ncbi:MAG: hypothetical protein KAI64_07610, partial [Thermoplasmata archaeon]|nr:hypothetical protein [Thermoplasmata archaeon]